MIPPRRAVPTVDAPCVRECCLDEADECIGCGRTLEEIKAWHAAGVGERETILRTAAQRRAARAARFERRSPVR